MRLLSRLSAAFFALAALVATPVMADQLQDILDRGTIRIGVIADVAPFGFLDENQQPAGLDIDVANLIASDLGVNLEIVPMTAPNRLPNLVTDKVDILVALLSLTTERAKQIMFTSPYSSTTIGVFGPSDTAVTSPEEIGGLSVGVTRGTVEDTAITRLAPDAFLTVLHAYEPPFEPLLQSYDVDPAAIAVHRRNARREGRQKLLDLLHQTGVARERVEFVQRRGYVASVILGAAARSGCDLIVLGRSPSKLPDLVFGSVVKRVLRRAPCDVLVVAR